MLITVGCGLNQLHAQTKFGYVNATEILFLMPEMKVAQHVLDSFQVVLDQELEAEVKKYKDLEQKLAQQIKEGASEALQDLTKQELQTEYEFIQKMQQTFEAEVGEKEQKLLLPLDEKVKKAVKEIALEKGLSYVFDISKGVLVFWEEKEDINKEVRKKLGIAEDAKLPTNNTNSTNNK